MYFRDFLFLLTDIRLFFAVKQLLQIPYQYEDTRKKTVRTEGLGKQLCYVCLRLFYLRLACSSCTLFCFLFLKMFVVYFF